MTMKFMYLTKRLPSLTPEGFSARWRQHGKLAMSLPFFKNMLRYVQADVLRPSPIPGTSLDFDGVSLTVARDDSLFTKPSPDNAENVKIMLKDEEETFDGPIPDVMFFVHEDVIRNVGPADVTAFLFFNDVAKAQSVADSLSNQGEKPDRIVVNRFRDDLKASQTPKLHYKAMVEAACTSVDKLKAAMANDTWRKADLTVVAREAILADIKS